MGALEDAGPQVVVFALRDGAFLEGPLEVLQLLALGDGRGALHLDVGIAPAGAEPEDEAGGRFWLINIGDKHKNDVRNDGVQTTTGVKALYMVCVHLGCLYGFEAAQNRFNCPCHGSMYTPSGHRITGPATRNLDVFSVQAVDADGKALDEVNRQTEFVNGEPRPLNVDGASKIRINTGERINGASNPTPRPANA